MNSLLTIKKYKLIETLFNKLYEIVEIVSESSSKKCELKDLFVPSKNEEDPKNDENFIFYRLCISLQNSGHMSQSIKFYGDNKEKIKKVTQNFDARKIIKKYGLANDIYNAFIEDEKIEDNGEGVENETNWGKYSKGIFEGAKYLVNGGFKNIKDLINLSNTIIEVKDEEYNNIIGLQKLIHGLGLALTCDWLKECGCTWLVKSDIHIKKVYQHLIEKDDDINFKVNEKEIIKEMFNWSLRIKQEYDPNMSAYKLDKMIWLICTGDFYKFGIKIGRDLIIDFVK